MSCTPQSEIRLEKIRDNYLGPDYGNFARLAKRLGKLAPSPCKEVPLQLIKRLLFCSENQPKTLKSCGRPQNGKSGPEEYRRYRDRRG
jgi:hypothetical protein